MSRSNIKLSRLLWQWVGPRESMVEMTPLIQSTFYVMSDVRAGFGDKNYWVRRDFICFGINYSPFHQILFLFKADVFHHFFILHIILQELVSFLSKWDHYAKPFSFNYLITVWHISLLPIKKNTIAIKEVPIKRKIQSKQLQLESRYNVIIIHKYWIVSTIFLF